MSELCAGQLHARVPPYSLLSLSLCPLPHSAASLRKHARSGLARLSCRPQREGEGSELKAELLRCVKGGREEGEERLMAIAELMEGGERREEGSRREPGRGRRRSVE